MGNESERPVRYPCPCCGYPTLDEPASHEICRVCDWQDDGQGDDDADDVGGPNSGQSLTYARDQFKRGMLSPAKGEPALQRELFECYERWKVASDSERDDILSEVFRLEAAVLEDMALNTSKYFSRFVDDV
jgi:hypothetical protein